MLWMKRFLFWYFAFLMRREWTIFSSFTWKTILLRSKKIFLFLFLSRSICSSQKFFDLILEHCPFCSESLLSENMRDYFAFCNLFFKLQDQFDILESAVLINDTILFFDTLCEGLYLWKSLINWCTAPFLLSLTIFFHFFTCIHYQFDDFLWSE